MSSRRGSAAVVASAGPSRSDSPLSPTAPSHDDEGEVDEKAATSRRRDLQTPTGPMESGDSSRGSSVPTNSSYIQRVPQLDIAFLHAVSTHRPLGPHKHFNLIPILMTLDRTARQVGADIRDGSASEDNTPMPPPEHEANDAAGSRRSRSISRRASGTAIKREEGDDVDANNRLLSEPPIILNMQIDAGMVRQRMEELYDVDGLEDLENQSIEAEDASPLASVPRPTFVSLASRKALGKSLADVPSVFGFGSSLLKLDTDGSAKAINGGSAASKKKTKALAAARAAAAEDDDELHHPVEFELGPWDEFERLIAPRRLKSYAPEEADEVSESDGELSDLEDEVEGDDVGEIEAIDDGVGEEGDGGEEDIDEEDEEEDEEEEEEDEGRGTGKRKGGTAKALPAAQRQKRNSGAGASTATGKRASRSSAAPAQPRRSTRR